MLEEVLSGFGRYRPWADAKEATMETKVPTPIRVALPAENPPPPTPPPRAGEGRELPLPLGEGWGEGPFSAPRRPVDSPPDETGEPKPRFIPLAVAIDLGMTPPIGSIRTTEVEVRPSEADKRPRPARRHLRLLPTPGA